MNLRYLACGLVLVMALRAQITEVPETVAPGRFLVKMDALSISTAPDEPGNGRYTALALAKTFVTTGLTDRLDVQVGAQLFLSEKVDSGGFSGHQSGIGDVYFRTKWRFYEDEDTGTMVAVMPYVKLPTSTGGVGTKATEGGLIIPWASKLAGWGRLQAMAELDLVRNNADNGYDTFWYVSAALTRALTNALGFYGEVTAGKSSGGAPWAGTIGGGVTLAVSGHFSWDYAVYRGISRGAPGWNPVVRANWRF